MDIHTLLQSPEDKTLEFKQDTSSHEGIVKTLIAFANTSGGTLVIGVEDKTKKIKGVDKPLDIEERLANLISSSISPKLIPNIEIVPWRKTYLVTVEIYPSNNRPHFLEKRGLEKGTFIRIGSTNRLADPSMIDELKRYSQSKSFDEQPNIALSKDEIDFNAVNDAFSEYRIIKDADYETLRLLTKVQKKYVPTNGGIILFGKNREKYFPDAWLQAGRFQGKDKSNIIDSENIDAYPIIAIKKTIDFIQKHLFHSMEIKTIKRQEKWNVPEIALREAIINAFVHADYSQSGAPIRVSIFDDRIEIENPGILPFSLTIDDLYAGVSKLRNPVIGRVFHELKLIERWGSGITRMTRACEEAGLEKPKLEEIAARFRVTIYLQKNPLAPPNIDAKDEQVLHLLSSNQGYSTTEIADNIGLSSRATRSRLIKLVNRQLVTEISSSPKDPNKKYFLQKGSTKYKHPQTDYTDKANIKKTFTRKPRK